MLIVIAMIVAGCTQTQQPGWEVKVEKSAESVEPETGIGPAAEEQVPMLTWTGCDVTKKAFMKPAAEEYEKKTGIKIEITGGGATKGIRAAAGGTADIGGTCRIAFPERFDEEKVLLTHVAWDALVFITHKNNPVDGITTQQAKDIMVGNITNWKELGGSDEKIIPVFRVQTESGKLSGVAYMTRMIFFNDQNIEYTSNAVFKTSSGPLEEYVEITPYTFAVSGISSARKRDLKIFKLDGIEPTKENIASGAYPLYRPLYLATKGEPTGEVKKFIDWMVSEEGQRVISDQGTVNLEEGKALKEKFQFWHNTDIIRNY